jgi:hypothetical protein
VPSLSAWITSPIAHLPKPPPPGDLEPYLRDMFDAHLSAVRGFGPGILEGAIQRELPAIDALGQGIIQAVRQHTRGQPAGAYDALRTALGGVSAHLRALNANVPAPNALPPTYRMRISDVPKRFGREELFHIPFDQRRRVTSKRFSIEGLPCLYLGHSTYVCWEEMGRSAFGSIYVAQFRFRDSAAVALLDFAYVPQFQSDLLAFWTANGANRTRLQDMLVALTVCWPLLSACAIRVREPGLAFKPEYVIPQLLLQWLTQETALHGIRYFSTNVGSPRGILIGANIVLPARTGGANGHCPALRAIFDVTEVWNWDVALAVGAPMRSTVVRGEIEAAPGAFVDYVTTDFWRIESMLNERPATPI